jgi:hypothetical protein
LSVGKGEHAMPVITNFNYTCEEGTIKGVSLFTVYDQTKTQPPFPGSKIKCDLDKVEVIILSDPRFRPKIFWSDEVFGRNGRPEILKEKRQDDLLDFALIEVREGVTWIARSEPTFDDRIGITVFDSKGRVRLAGVGDLTPIETPPTEPGMDPEHGYRFTYFLKAIYRWGTPNPKGCPTDNEVSGQKDTNENQEVFTNVNTNKQLKEVELDQ